MAAHAEVGPEELLAGVRLLSRPAEEFENDDIQISDRSLTEIFSFCHSISQSFCILHPQYHRKCDPKPLFINKNPHLRHPPSLELMWAKKAYEHAEIYFNILCSVDPTLLKLTPNDNEIYETFKRDFPNLCVQFIDENEMKSAAGKQKWREYCEKFKSKVEDFSFGTLLRKDCTGEYTEDNSILVTRIQFLAIELARNKEGYNNCIRDKYKQNKNEEP